MTEKTEFLQAIDDAILDADSLERFINGSEDETVLTRLSAEYPTLQKALKELFENGGIAERYKTVEQLQVEGVDLSDGAYALVADDTDENNGIYIKENGAWRKTRYDYAKMIRVLLDDYYNDKVITPEWELGSLSNTGSHWDEPLNRMRLKNGPVPAPYERITVECLNPDLEVVLCVWDDEGGFSLGTPYSDSASKLIKQGYSVIARYKDERPIVLSEIKDTDIRITKMSNIKTDIDSFKNKVDLLDQWFAGVTYNTLEWESGSISSATGLLNNNHDRLTTRVRNAPYQEKYKGKLRIRPNNTAQQFAIYLYNELGDLVSYSGWGQHREVDVDGFYSVVVAWDDFSPIVPSDVDLIIEYLPKNFSYIEELLSTVESSSQAIVDYMISGTFNLNWNLEVGSFTNTGVLWDKVPADRLRLKNNVKYKGYIEIFSANPDMSINIVEFDEEGNFVRYNSYAQSQKRYVNGYFNILVRWNDDRLIYPTDADLTLKAGEDNTVEFNVIKSIVLQESYPTDWEVGSFTNAGVLWDRPERNRLRMATNSIKFSGTVYVESLNPEMSINIVEFDEFGDFIKYNSYVLQQNRLINGYFNVLVRWNDDREISVDDAQVKITLNKTAQATNESDAGELNWFEQTPQFSSVPFGHLLNRPLEELQTAFDGLVSQYPYQSKKEVFGRTGDDLYDMHAYTLEPPYPEACIAITMHTHGNERWNPLGFFALLDLFGKNTPQHSLITWLRDKVKWYVVPFMSPRAVVDNTRATRGINLNRNFDFLFNETVDGSKGSAPYSLPEAQNIYDFFVVRKDEIMFHLDLHDIPLAGGDVYSHNPAHHRQFVWLKEQKQMQKHLADINGGRGDTDYPFENGSVLSLFLGVFAIPSVTPEHVTQWWINRGLKPDQQIAKALEQTCGFLYLFKHMLDNKDTRNSAFYTRDLEVPFASLASGHISWSKQQVKDAFNEVGFLQEINSDGVFVNEGSNSNKSILLITGMYDDDNNSDLTALRVVEQINSSESVFVNLLKDSKLIVAPAISDGLSEGEVNSRITNLINKYQPNYTVLVEAPKLDASTNLTRVETSNSTYLTSKTKEATYGVYIEQNGYAENLSTRYTHFKLANEVPKHAIYPHTVANWVGLVLNDLASYYAEK